MERSMIKRTIHCRVTSRTMALDRNSFPYRKGKGRMENVHCVMLFAQESCVKTDKMFAAFVSMHAQRKYI